MRPLLPPRSPFFARFNHPQGYLHLHERAATDSLFSRTSVRSDSSQTGSGTRPAQDHPVAHDALPEPAPARLWTSRSTLPWPFRRTRPTRTGIPPDGNPEGAAEPAENGFDDTAAHSWAAPCGQRNDSSSYVPYHAISYNRTNFSGLSLFCLADSTPTSIATTPSQALAQTIARRPRSSTPRSSPPASGKSKFPIIPTKYRPLVDYLLELHQQGDVRPLRASLGTQIGMLEPRPYTTSFKIYAAEAEKAGIVRFSKTSGTGIETIELAVRCRDLGTLFVLELGLTIRYIDTDSGGPTSNDLRVQAVVSARFAPAAPHADEPEPPVRAAGSPPAVRHHPHEAQQRTLIQSFRGAAFATPTAQNEASRRVVVAASSPARLAPRIGARPPAISAAADGPSAASAARQPRPALRLHPVAALPVRRGARDLQPRRRGRQDVGRIPRSRRDAWTGRDGWIAWGAVGLAKVSSGER